MIHFKSRDEIVAWLRTQDIPGHVGIALQDGNIEFLGGFRSIPPRNWPGWIVRVTRKIGTRVYTYYVSIVVNGFKMKLVNTPEALVPWENWDGNRTDNELYQGDFPEKYKELKDAKKTRTHEGQ